MQEGKQSMRINEKQLAQVNDRIKALVSAGSFYGKKLKEKNITSVNSVEEFEKLPFSEKNDLRDAYPLGLMTAPEEEIVRIHSSSGTTGLPVIIPYTAKDVDDWGEMFKRCYEVAGITNKDRIHITPGYGLWTAGIGFQNGCEKLGAMAIPMGPGNTNKQIQMMQDMKSTVLCSTSSYALLLAEEIEKRGIQDMWLIDLRDKNGVDLYPEVRSRVDDYLARPDAHNKVRMEYIKHFGYYVTESSEHNAEYNMFYIKSRYPELIERYNIPLDEYPRRCVNQIERWKSEYAEILETGIKEHTRTNEYASRIMEAVVTGVPFQIGGNVLNSGRLITNLPDDACVEVPCLVNAHGVNPCCVGALPVQCAAMNMTNINVQLLTIEAAVTRKKDHIYQAAMLDPHTGSELDVDTIKKMVDDLIEAHGSFLPAYH